MNNVTSASKANPTVTQFKDSNPNATAPAAPGFGPRSASTPALESAPPNTPLSSQPMVQARAPAQAEKTSSPKAEELKPLSANLWGCKELEPALLVQVESGGFTDIKLNNSENYALAEELFEAATRNKKLKRFAFYMKPGLSTIYKGTALFDLIKNNRLEFLSLSWLKLDGAGRKALGEAIAANTSLTALELRCMIEDDAGLLLKAISIHPELQTLKLVTSKQDDELHEALTGLLSSNKKLRNLNLVVEDWAMSPFKFALESGLKANSCLRCLTLSWANLPSKQLTAPDVDCLIALMKAGKGDVRLSIDSHVRLDVEGARRMHAFLDANPAQISFRSWEVRSPSGQSSGASESESLGTQLRTAMARNNRLPAQKFDAKVALAMLTKHQDPLFPIEVLEVMVNIMAISPQGSDTIAQLSNSIPASTRAREN